MKYQVSLLAVKDIEVSKNFTKNYLNKKLNWT